LDKEFSVVNKKKKRRKKREFASQQEGYSNHEKNSNSVVSMPIH